MHPASYCFLSCFWEGKRQKFETLSSLKDLVLFLPSFILQNYPACPSWRLFSFLVKFQFPRVLRVRNVYTNLNLPVLRKNNSTLCKLICSSDEKKLYSILSKSLFQGVVCCSSLDWVQTDVLTDGLHFRWKNPPPDIFISSSPIPFQINTSLRKTLMPRFRDLKWWRIHQEKNQTDQVMSSFSSSQQQYLQTVQPTHIQLTLLHVAHEREWQHLPRIQNQVILTFLPVSWLVLAWPLPARFPPAAPASWWCILAAASPPILMQQLSSLFPVLGTWQNNREKEKAWSTLFPFSWWIWHKWAL